MNRPKPTAALPDVPGWPPERIAERLPSPASQRDADAARFWNDLDPSIDPARLPMHVQTDRPGKARRAGSRRGAPAMPQRRMNTGVSNASSIAKRIVLGVIVPLVGGMGWLTWIVAQETRTVLQAWQPVEVTVLDKSDGDTVRLAIESGGTRRETEVPRSSDLKAFSAGERFSAYADPNNPDMLRPATGGALWGGVGMLAFFTLALAGAGLFLLRSGLPPR